MQARVDEIADRIFRISTHVPELGPGGFTFNQFLIDAEQPLLFHTGMRALFPAVREAVARVIDAGKLRWIGFGHVEADECGSMNQWLAAEPNAQVVHGQIGCEVSLNDMADRMPRALGDGEVLDLGGRQIRLLATPHLPHNWETVVLFEEATRTLLCGDVFAHFGDPPAIVTSSLIEPAMDAERAFPGGTALGPSLPVMLERLAALEPKTLALMHGASFSGDGAAELRGLAAAYRRFMAEA
jgi:flavorubredoxin